MAQDRPEEFDRLDPPERVEAEEDFEPRRLANVVVLLAALALVLIGYWVFNALGHSRRSPALPRFGPHQLRRLRQSRQVSAGRLLA